MTILEMEFIVVEILARLPVKTLIRFKSVCKSLNSLISSHDFTRIYPRHQSLSSSAADNRLILAGNRRISCYHLDPHATTSTSTFVYSKKRPIMSVIGASNGLLCIRLSGANSSEFCILNPTTRICRYIKNALEEEVEGSHNHGFGFDHENLDYVIVVVSNYTDKSAMKKQITRVYSLNNNSWRVIETAYPTDTTEPLLRTGGVLSDNSSLHWMFWAPALHKSRIGCFDICKKKWTDDVLLPRFYYDPTCKKKNYLVDIGVVDDCLFSTFKDGIENRYNVWIMKEYRVQDSWVILFNIPVSSYFNEEVINPVACCQSSDMVLVRQLYPSKFFWYNKVDGGMSEAKFVVASNSWNLQAYMCSTSLVDIPGGGQLFEHFHFTSNT